MHENGNYFLALAFLEVEKGFKEQIYLKIYLIPIEKMKKIRAF